MMSVEGRVCWPGVRNNQPTCHCSSQAPLFNITFPVADISTIAPPTVTDNAKEGSTLPLTKPMMLRTTTESPRRTPKPLTLNSMSLRMLIATSLSLFLLLFFLACLVTFFMKRKKKRNDGEEQQPDEDCDEDDISYEVSTDQPESDGNQHIPLAQLGELYLYTDTADSSHTTKLDWSLLDSVQQNFPVLKTVRAKEVGNGSPTKCSNRPVSRQDSTAPLVEHEVMIARDKRKEKKSRRNGSEPRIIEDENNLGICDTRLPQVKEATKQTTKLEQLPSRHFPAIDIVNVDVVSSPGQTREVSRLNWSTPLYDNDSVESTDV